MITWNRVSEKLPRTDVLVLVSIPQAFGEATWLKPAFARYYPAGAYGASHMDEPPEDWWNEEADSYVNPEPIWVEEFNGETPYVSELNVTHWADAPSVRGLT